MPLTIWHIKSTVHILYTGAVLLLIQKINWTTAREPNYKGSFHRKYWDHRIVQYRDQYQQPPQIHWPAYYLHQRGQPDYYYDPHLSGMLNEQGHPQKSVGTGEEPPALINLKGVYRRNELYHPAYPNYPYYYPPPPPVYEAESSNANSTSLPPTKKPVNRERVEFLKSLMADFFRVTRSFG